MSLPSQMSLGQNRRSHMYRRRRRRRRPVLYTFCSIALGSLLIWWILPSGGDASGPEPAQSLGQIPLEMNGPDEGFPSSSSSNSPTTLIIDPTANLEQKHPSTAANYGQPPELIMGLGDPRNPGIKTSLENTKATSPKIAERAKTSTTTPPARSIGQTPTRQFSSASPRARRLIQSGMELLSSNRLVEARDVLSTVLRDSSLSPTQRKEIKASLSQLSDRMVYSPEVMEGDYFAMSYVLQGGDVLSTIVKRFALQVDWRFIQRINNIAKPSRIRAGQRIKLITGPFHAVIHKNSYQLDLYLGDEDNRVFVKSYPVGLGVFNSTPIGMFRIRSHSKLINPEWSDPRTGRTYSADDPANPIGERWLGLQGLDEATRDLMGYGIHGTIAPETIGKQASMGCIRMRSQDVEVIYEVLVESVSTVEIRND